jgi:nitrous oxidase accessory protein NosD
VDGVYAKDVDRAEVEQCELLYNGRDGFIGIPVRHLRFSQNLAKGNGRMGCTSDVDPEHKSGGPLSATYLSNEVIDCGTGGLHVESEEGLPVAEALFERNRILDCGNRDWGYSWGLVIGNHSKGVIRGNVIEGTGLHSRLDAYRNGIHLDLPGGACLVEGNTVKRSGRMGISVSRSPFPVRLIGNVVRDSGNHGIAAYQIEGLQVRDCTVSGASQWGLWLRLCASADISSNHFTNNSQEGPGKYAAIRVENSLGLKIVANDLGGPPHKVGLELESNTFGTQISFEGNLFEGRRKHPQLSSFRTEN